MVGLSSLTWSASGERREEAAEAQWQQKRAGFRDQFASFPFLLCLDVVIQSW